MNAAPDIRPATDATLAACAAIQNHWIDTTGWMPRIHPAEDVEHHLRKTMAPNQSIWTSGDPVQGFLAHDAQAGEVTALFVAEDARGQGHGTALLDHVKRDASSLHLWTFAANTRARRFYIREGFAEIGATGGDNEERLPDIRMAWHKAPIRRATREDVPTCARIVHRWVQATPWMPKPHGEAALRDFIAEALPEREIFLIGDPPQGYLSINPAANHIGALYVDRPGQGLGRALMDRAKAGRDRLRLNTHEPNTAAHRFYAREGFKVVDRIETGTDGMPELVMEWQR